MSDQHKSIRAVVTIACDNLNRVKSSHCLATPQDHMVAGGWPSGGQAQLAHGLLFESARREAILSLLVLLQNEERWLQETHALSDEACAARLQEVSQKVLTNMTKTLSLLVENAVTESYREMLKPLDQPLDA